MRTQGQGQGNRQTEHKFSQIPKATIPRSQFNRSHTHKTTFDAGLLIPIYVDEVLPGDTFNLNMTMFGRLATPIFPIMDNLIMDIFFFFIPNRLVWTNWPRFCGEQIDPDASTDFTIPTTLAHASSALVELGLYDHMGVPPTTNSIVFNNLLGRGYNLVWNEWFRDQNLQDRITVDLDDGPDTDGDYDVLRRRGKRHDYFTSCLPWPQKGDAIELPLGTTAPVDFTLTGAPTFNIGSATDKGLIREIAGPNLDVSWEGGDPGAGGTTPAEWNSVVNLGFTGIANLSTATAATINSLRQAFQIQKLLERDARGGTRYTEIVKSHFGVTSPDARLQRSEFLSSGSSPVVINTAVQATQAAPSATGWDRDKKGSLAGWGTIAGSGIGFTKSFVEHGHILGLVCVRADLTYSQGLHRMWSRQTRNDFYWPAFANLGEQAVLNQEIWIQDPSGAPGITENIAVFGYQERWAEYRYYPSMLTGLMRVDHGNSLKAWHLSQDFATLPVLGDTFIQETPPVTRVIAVQTEPHFIFDAYFDIKCARTMPVYSVPGLIDHF